VAEQGRAEPFDLDDERLLEGGQEVSVSLVDHRGRPGRGRSLDATLLGRDRGTRVELLDGPSIGVAAHEDRSVAERTQQLDRGHGQRSGHRVAADDDQIDGLLFELGEDGAQRDGVGVDVVESGDAHALRRRRGGRPRTLRRPGKPRPRRA
jgi:hypothetical protein